MPTVKVVVPSYDAAKYVREAVNSVRAQTHRDQGLLGLNNGMLRQGGGGACPGSAQ